MKRTIFQKDMLKRGMPAFKQAGREEVVKEFSPGPANVQFELKQEEKNGTKGGRVIGTLVSKDTVKLEELIKKTDTVLFQASTWFPFDLFPDTITVDENKVTIVKRLFLSSSQTQNYMLEDIKDVIVGKALFFAALTLKLERYTENALEVTVKPLKVDDAEAARKVILGLMVALRQGVQLEKTDQKNISKTIEEIGNTGTLSG